MFLGIAKVTLWDPDIDRRTGSPSSTQRFTRLCQPADESLEPEGTTLESGRVYRFPFLFVVPSGLLPQVCQHPCEHPEVRRHHLYLPPSLGLGFHPKERNLFSLSLEPDAVSKPPKSIPERTYQFAPSTSYTESMSFQSCPRCQPCSFFEIAKPISCRKRSSSENSMGKSWAFSLRQQASQKLFSSVKCIHSPCNLRQQC